jgi:hypothetical protein
VKYRGADEMLYKQRGILVCLVRTMNMNFSIHVH